jgi:hypothetical protein
MRNLSIGVNGYYMFGTLDYSNILWFPDQANSFGTRNRVKHTVSGLGWDAGLQYEAHLGGTNRVQRHLVLGATASLPGSVPTATDSIVDRVVVVDDETFAHLDSLQSSLATPTTLQLPLTLGFGVGYRSQKIGEDSVGKHTSRFFAGADFIWQKWSGTNGLLSGELSDSWRFAAGLSYTPTDFLSKRFFQRNTYRLGMHYGRHYLQLNGNPVSDFGIAFGLGIPLVQESEIGSGKSAVASSLDLSFDVGRAGSVGDNLVAENYVRFTLGINLNNNYWLFKTKID